MGVCFAELLFFQKLWEFALGTQFCVTVVNLRHECDLAKKYKKLHDRNFAIFWGCS